MGCLIQNMGLRGALLGNDVPAGGDILQNENTVQPGGDILVFLCPLLGDPQGDAGNTLAALLIHLADGEVGHPVVVDAKDGSLTGLGLDIADLVVQDVVGWAADFLNRVPILFQILNEDGAVRAGGKFLVLGAVLQRKAEHRALQLLAGHLVDLLDQ